MDCDQIIYLGLFAIIAIYLYQNVLRPEPFRVGANFPGGGGGGGGGGNSQLAMTQDAAKQYRAAENAAQNAQIAQAQNATAQATRAVDATVQRDLNAVAQTGVRASVENIGQNEMDLPVEFNRTPSTCYPEKNLTASELLPTEESKEISEFNQNYPIGEGILKGINFLSSGYHVGVNTVGQSLKNANRQLRSEPPNPQVSVSPWMNSSIGPDLLRRPLEVGDSCGK